jgi:hypothetical protein
MKTLLSALLTLGLALSVSQAAVITSVTTTPSLTSGTTVNGDNILTSITTGSTTYSTLIAPIAVHDDAGSEYIWHASATEPSSIPAPSLDLNLGTGTFNISFGATATTGAWFEFSSVDSTTVFFAIDNTGASSGDIITYLVDGTGANISSNIRVDYSATNFASGTFDRSVGGSLTRSLSGMTFAASDYTLDSGKTFADVAGVRFSNASWDPQAVGIAVIPEPATLTMVAIAISLLLGSRLRGKH